jgi:hypothetical protein
LVTDEVDDHQDREHHDTDHVVTADHHLTEGLDHLTGGGVAVLAVEHHHPGGGHVQRQAQQRRHQQDGREHREIQRPQAYTHTSSTTIDRAMLKVKNTSSRNGGIGNIIIASITSSNSGTPRLPRPRSARLLRAVLIN